MRGGVMGLSVVALAVGLVFLVSPGHGETYKWIDQKGTVWFTDDPDKLPQKSEGQLEEVKGVEESPDSASTRGEIGEPAIGNQATGSVKDYLEESSRQDQERQALEKEISTLQKELGTARMALQRVPSSDLRGYWFAIDSAGKKVRASYKEPGAVWSNDTWPAVPLSSRVRASDERKGIEADISRMEKDLEAARKKRSALFQSP